MKVLVTGATGYIGGRLIPKLLTQGAEVRVLVRDARRVSGRAWSDRVEIVTGDVEDPESLPRACAGMDAAYYLVHLMGSGADFDERDRRAAHHFVEAGAHLKRVVYLGGLVPEGPAISRHLASRAEVGRILREGLPTVEFRAGPVIGSGSASFEMVRYLTERLPAMVAPRWIVNPVQPISVRDVLAYLTHALEGDRESIYEIGGEPLSFKEMMHGFADVRGLKRIILPVSVLAPRLAARWVGLVTPIPNSLAVPLIEGVVHPVLADVTAAQRDFPNIHPMGYREAVRRALERTDHDDVETRWSGALGTAAPVALSGERGLVREVRTVQTDAGADAIFGVITSMGGDRGWMTWNWAWRFRGFIDRMVGGPGLRRGRRHPTTLETGDAVDFWRVERIEAPTLLRLRAEMKVPGEAWLEWQIADEQGRTHLIQSAIFAPKGLFGLLYWYALYPAHRLIFSSLINRIARAADAR